MGTARHARRALIAAATALLCFVVVFAAAGNSVRSVVSGAFGKSEEIRVARATLAQAVTLQLDEETGVRGSMATGQRGFLEPYHLGRTQLPRTLADLQKQVDALRSPDASRHARRLLALNHEWTTGVARPLLVLPPSNALREQQRGKVLVDRFRTEAAALDAVLDRRRIAVNDAMQSAIWRVGTYVLFSILVIAALAAGLVAVQLHFLDRLERERARADDERLRAGRLQTAYETEKRIADKLQSALFQRPLPSTPGLELSATYAPAEEETRVGGDWYDVLEIPGDRVFFAIGDVAGHGIDAAVAMNRARHALISAAMRASDPRAILAHANEELHRDGIAMVTAVAGFANYRTYEFDLAVAGHPPPLLLEPSRPPRLLSCGGLPLGVASADSYTTQHVQTVPGSAMVLYTDGAIEHSRDPLAGERILIDAATTSARDREYARTIYDEIFSSRRLHDDVAILTVGFPAVASAAHARTGSDAALPARTLRNAREASAEPSPRARRQTLGDLEAAS